MKCRPSFIPKDKFRTWMSPTRITDYICIDKLQGASYIAKCARNNIPIRHSGGNKTKQYRLIDVCAHAAANGLLIEHSNAAELKLGIKALKTQRAKLCTEIEHLEDIRKNCTHDLALNQISRTLTTKQLLTEEEIVEHSVEHPSMCGVYFLIFQHTVVYVGQSVNIYQRIGSHYGMKNFTHFAHIICKPEDLDIIESLYIHYLRPTYNGNINKNNKGKLAPISFEHLLTKLNH